MGKIKVLPNNLINQIAAGEVIERPASVVKELVENSIDALSSKIEVMIEDGGLSKIEIVDNGTGIPFLELKTAFIRHATSKISFEEDLYNIKSLGFRGEALPSISSVSKVTIKSRTKNSPEGHLMSFEGGEFIEHRVVACKVGTTITVENLFFNTPARLKFMSSARAEAARISNLFKQMALSNPEIAFKYYRNRKEIAYTDGSNKLTNVISSLFDVKLASNLIEISFSRNGYYVKGFISEPKYSLSNRKNQYFFVNNRCISDSNIRHALESAYGNMLSPRTYPAAFLYLEIPPEDVDVNVHPAKTEVRFANKGEVHALITSAVRDSLSKSIRFVQQVSEIYHTQNEVVVTSSELPANHQLQIVKEDAPIIILDNDKEKSIKQNIETPSYSQGYETFSFEKDIKTRVPSEVLQDTNQMQSSIPSELSQVMILGQIHSSFIVIQNKEGMAIIDQHAAHERVIVEKLRSIKKDQHTQYFAVPLTLSFSKISFNLVKDYISEINSLGIVLEPFGQNSFLVRGIPDFLVGRLSIDELKEVITDVFNAKANINKWYDNILIQLSCKAAIKINQSLSRSEMLTLISDLAKSKNWKFCPHGRPVIWKISISDLERKFNRV